MEDYDFDLQNHLGKANVVADALSQKTVSSLANLAIREWEMLRDVGQFDLQLGATEGRATLLFIVVQHTLLDQVIALQQTDTEAQAIRTRIVEGSRTPGRTLQGDNSLRFMGKLCRHPILIGYCLQPAKHDCTMTKHDSQKFYLRVGEKQNRCSILWSPFLAFQPFSTVKL